MVRLSCLVLAALPLSFAAPASYEERQLSPSVQLSYATVVGSSAAGIDSFKGIPYAQPPMGQLRLKPPQSITSNLGTIQATGIPRACPQYLLDTGSLPTGVLGQLLDTPFLQAATVSGEDCLTVNVQRPSNATAGSLLPVIFWIYGGAFQFGSTQMYDASELILTSMAQNKEVIYVAVNYRVSGFGFMPGSAILADGSSNLGLLDQRLGLEWVADNIAKFGGDPSKVTIWGESAGSVSVFDQMAIYNGDNTYKGKPLFRAAIMDSGSIIPSDPVDCPKGEAVYNTVVQNAGCSGATDTLECLRGVDYTTFLNAVNSAPSIFDYSGIAISYQPRPDGSVLTASPELLVKNGKYAHVPFIIGDQEDEGTLFSLTQTNLTNTAQLTTCLNTYLLQDATPAQVLAFVNLYPDNPSAGSPFRTGPLNNIYPEYKRLAAIAGDITFNLVRRIFLNSSSLIAPSVPSWSYLASYDYGVPVLGTFHASDIAPAYGETPGFPSTTIQSYYLSFINALDPNVGTTGLPNWPQWSVGKELMGFGALTNSLVPDTFREAAAEYIAAMGSAFYF